MRDPYLDTNEQFDVLVSLREAIHQLERVQCDPHCWKWVVNALISAANGAMVCNLSGSMGIGALKEEAQKKMIKALDVAMRTQGVVSDLPNSFLETPGMLFGNLKNQRRVEPGSGPSHKLSDEVEKDFKWLIGVRNNFTHFQPQGWSIHIPSIAATGLSTLSIVEAVAKDGHSLRHLNEIDYGEVIKSCEEIATMLERVLTSFRAKD